MMVRPIGIILVMILCIAGIAGPVSAFRAEQLDIRIQENGDADVQFVYGLSWFENVVVFLRVVDPAQQLEQELEDYSGKDVVVQAVTGNAATLRIITFASVHTDTGSVTYRTPELQFMDAAAIAQKYWWANIVKVDMRPVHTVVTFPDGYAETFENAATVPVLTHTV